MRRTIFLAALLFAAPAQAATSLPAATEPGVRVSPQGGGAYLVKFTQSAYKPYAGRSLDVVCMSSAARLGGAGPPKRSVTRVRLRLRLSSIRVKPPRGDNVCAFVRGEAEVGSAELFVALTPSGRRWLADFETSALVGAVLISAREAGRTGGAWPAYAALPKRIRQETARLASPGSNPSGKALGYYSDGAKRVTVVGRSASGRRLTFAMDGDDATTNTAGVTNVIAPPSEPSGTLPVGPFPAAGTPLPDATVAGVSASQTGSEVAVAFSGPDAEAAYARIAGKRTVVTCSRAAVPVLGILIPRDATFTVTPPAQAGTLRLDVGSGAVSTCSLGVAPGAPVVQVAVGEAGRAPLEEGLSAQALLIVARRVAGAGTGAYSSAESVATSLGNATAVLASPGDTPADRRVGVYSDGRSHMAVVVRTMTGRRLYIEYTGEEVRTNGLSVTELVPF